MEPGAEGLTDAGLGAVVYCDSSALVRAYLADEAGHSGLSRLLLDPRRLVATSALTEVEMVAAIRAAARAGRRFATRTWPSPKPSADMGTGGPVALLALESGHVLPRARALCEIHRLRALDAVHLAVALAEAAGARADDADRLRHPGRRPGRRGASRGASAGLTAAAWPGGQTPSAPPGPRAKDRSVAALRG